jgi:hypothetical protein
MKDQHDLERIMKGIERDVNAIPDFLLGSSSVPQEFGSNEARRNSEAQDAEKKR